MRPNALFLPHTHTSHALSFSRSPFLQEASNRLLFLIVVIYVSVFERLQRLVRIIKPQNAITVAEAARKLLLELNFPPLAPSFVLFLRTGVNTYKDAKAYSYV